MHDIVVELWDGEQKIASKQYKLPLTAAELKTALAQENRDWTGTLQKAGSSTGLNGGQRLEGGASHHFRLQTSSKNKHSPEEEIMNVAEAPRQYIREWGNHQILVQLKGDKRCYHLQLYLASNDADETSLGRVMTQHIRVMMHGLTSEVPIMYCLCARNHSFNSAAAGCQLLETQEGLSEMQFDDTCKLYVWPGILEHIAEEVGMAYNKVINMFAHVTLSNPLSSCQAWSRPSKKQH